MKEYQLTPQVNNDGPYWSEVRHKEKQKILIEELWGCLADMVCFYAPDNKRMHNDESIVIANAKRALWLTLENKYGKAVVSEARRYDRKMNNNAE